MNKTELVAAIAEKAGLSKKDAEGAVKAFTDTVAEQLKAGEKIQLEVSVHLKLLKELLEQERILRQAKLLRFLLLRLQSSRLVRL